MKRGDLGISLRKMELKDQLRSKRGQYSCSQPPVELDLSANHHVFCRELKISSVGRVRAKSCKNRSFAMDARIRLNSLKSGYSSGVPCCAVDGMLFREPWDSEESDDEESALDLVELLDMDEDVQDEENWLYESPKKQVFIGGRKKSALGWCRHVLDNPSPQMEAACRSLINRLDHKSSSYFFRRPAVDSHTGSISLKSSVHKTFVSTTQNPSASTDNISHEESKRHRLQDNTDVHMMTRIQEASLRHDYISSPGAVSAWKGVLPPMISPSYFNTSFENTDNLTEGKRAEPSSSFGRQTGLSSTSCCLSPPASLPKQVCQSPKLSRLHQQVTQFKLLKLAQNQETSPGRMRSPLRTSLRSLQAVRNSRSLEVDDYQPAESQITDPSSGSSPVIKVSGFWSPSLSAASENSNGFLKSEKDSLERKAAVKRLQRSQSVSPCRIYHQTKGYMSVNGRVCLT